MNGPDEVSTVRLRWNVSQCMLWSLNQKLGSLWTIQSDPFAELVQLRIPRSNKPAVPFSPGLPPYFVLKLGNGLETPFRGDAGATPSPVKKYESKGPKMRTRQARLMNGPDEVSTVRLRWNVNACFEALTRNWAHYEPFNLIHSLSSFNCQHSTHAKLCEYSFRTFFPLRHHHYSIIDNTRF